MAGDTRAINFVAELASLLVSSLGNRRDALRRLQCLGVSKLDLGSPDSASNVNPVVVCSPLQRLSRVDGTVQILLSFTVIVCRFTCLLDLEFLAFTVLLRHLLLVMCELWKLNEIPLGFFDGTQNAFVMLNQCQYMDYISTTAISNR